MNTFLWKVIFVFFLTFSISLASGPEKFTVALNIKPSFPNRGMKGTENSLYPGVAFETLKLIEKEINIPIEFIRLPYKRCLMTLEKGLCDAVMTGSYNKKREIHGLYPRRRGDVDVTRRVYNSSYYLYVRKDSSLMWNGANFTNLNKSISAEYGFSVVDDLKKLNVDVVTCRSGEECMKSVQTGRTGAFAAHESTAEPLLRRYSDMKRLEIPFETKPYYLLISHQFYNQYPDLSETIWNVIANLRIQTLEWQMIKDRYYELDHWQEGGFD